VAQHVRVNLEGHLCLDTGALNQLGYLRNDLLHHAAVTKDKSPRSRRTTEGFLLCAEPGLRSAQLTAFSATQHL